MSIASSKYSLYSIIINVELYNQKNLLKPKILVTETKGLNVMQLKVFNCKLNNINTWCDRVNFLRQYVDGKEHMKIPNDEKKIQKIKFIYMNYEESRKGKWGPFAEKSFCNPKKIIGIIKSIVKIKKLLSKNSFVWV